MPKAAIKQVDNTVLLNLSLNYKPIRFTVSDVLS